MGGKRGMLGLFQSGREKVERIEGEGKIVIEFNCVFVFCLIDIFMLQPNDDDDDERK